ncbi:MAG: nucleotidyltransferase domain-containing protein [Caldilineaceae bacterium]|nr:nucleotidyltransferase domain-containing protein [Caldilineaceae bacterium]MBP8108948.1 nucleotidyltransferase domain-containing protein [Caldilineaceae bacterium]MBP8123838.1 nucleotidyltransferase domain-containing protein [Caldilineaceae bacterium]MBP9073887.1 nucleotidyltransferase domain-containing protein [Caldilineaceae bacterium]
MVAIVKHSEEIEDFDEMGLVALLRAQPDIIAAYLFGSRATGHFHPNSDVDIAVLLDENTLPQETDWGSPVFNRRLALLAAVEGFARCKVDLITLNTAPPLLCFQVLHAGRLLYEGNRPQRIEFEVRTGKIYNDMEPAYEFFNRALRHELQGGGFGKARFRS